MEDGFIFAPRKGVAKRQIAGHRRCWNSRKLLTHSSRFRTVRKIGLWLTRIIQELGIF